ncbi:MAG: hypothetical protein WCX65_10075 [bacterium]
MKLLGELKKIIRDEAPAQAAALFALYNKIAVATADEITSSKDALHAELAGIKSAFDAMNKKIAKMKEPPMAPFSLKVTIGASREKGKKHLYDCSKAAEAMNKYLDSGDKADLKTAAEMLEPMAG